MPVPMPMTIFFWSAPRPRADYVVTGNLKDFPAKWADAQIVSARRFLDALADIREEPH